MALANFTSYVTKVTATWLNKIDVLFVTIFGEATTKAAARTALTNDGYSNASPTYNSSPITATTFTVRQGDDTTAATNGNTPTLTVQRVDQTTTAQDASAADSPSYLISNIYNVFKRKATGKGWLYGIYNYLEDASTSGTAQSVACAGVAHTTGAANTAVWGLYGEAHARGANTIATGAEFNCYNYSGSDYTYTDSNPVTYPFTMGSWVLGGGTKKNTIGYGLGTVTNSSALTNSFRTGIFLQTYSTTGIGIDIQSMPTTGIRFKNGASTDGSHTTAGGIGIDFGASASYAAGSLNNQNQGAIHLRGHAVCFGSDGLGHMYYDGAGKFQFNYNGTNVGYINCASSPDVQINGNIAPAIVTGAGATSSTISAAYGSIIVTVTGGTTTLTLPSPVTYSGKTIMIKNGSATPGTTVSASANIKQLDHQTTTTAILAATAGKWATLQADGTNWVIMAAN